MSRHQPICLHRFPGAAAFVVGSALILSGCGDTPSTTGNGSPGNGTVTTPPPGADDHGHAHPTEGPHHGDLVELGNEDYHAEIVHGDGGEITIYVLDSAAKAAVPIDATEVAINLTHDGEAEQFKLPATPDSGDAAGKSSRFTLKDEHLAEDLDAEGTIAKLVLTINGKQYSGKIEHDHDHTGYGHAH